MNPTTIQLGAQIALQMLQALQEWQAKVAAGTITDADIDAKLASLNTGSRADLVQAITDARAAATA